MGVALFDRCAHGWTEARKGMVRGCTLYAPIGSVHKAYILGPTIVLPRTWRRLAPAGRRTHELILARIGASSGRAGSANKSRLGTEGDTRWIRGRCELQIPYHREFVARMPPQASAHPPPICAGRPCQINAFPRTTANEPKHGRCLEARVRPKPGRGCMRDI